MDLAELPDGSVLLSDDFFGAVYRITWSCDGRVPPVQYFPSANAGVAEAPAGSDSPAGAPDQAPAGAASPAVAPEALPAGAPAPGVVSRAACSCSERRASTGAQCSVISYTGSRGPRPGLGGQGARCYARGHWCQRLPEGAGSQRCMSVTGFIRYATLQAGNASY